jgi:hypothetical protein
MTGLDLGTAVHQDMSAVTPQERALPVAVYFSHEQCTREMQAAPPVAEPRPAELHTQIEALGSPPQLMVGAASLHASGMMAQCFARAAYQPAWGGVNSPRPCVESLIYALRDPERAGLRPPGDHLALHVSRDAGRRDAVDHAHPV